jgi:hypothetical protein
LSNDSGNQLALINCIIVGKKINSIRLSNADVEELEDAVHASWDSITQDEINSLVRSFPQRVKRMLERGGQDCQKKSRISVANHREVDHKAAECVNVWCSRPGVGYRFCNAFDKTSIGETIARA